MTIKPIRTKADYEAALKRLDKIFDAKPGNHRISFRPHFPAIVKRPGVDRVAAMAFMATVFDFGW